ncbi:MAG TPA: hypothetical protein VLW50_28170 [Streptosporangiaceae bacterium]|nr:hypothetical protein [Streptosporangiaceae bacterium]
MDNSRQAARRPAAAASGARTSCWRRRSGRPAPCDCFWLLNGRTRGPVFSSPIPIAIPGPARSSSHATSAPTPAPTPISLGSYGQARAPLDRHTGVGGVADTGWDLHECRHFGLTHLGEAGASLPMLMAKSRHKKPENVPATPMSR